MFTGSCNCTILNILASGGDINVTVDPVQFDLDQNKAKIGERMVSHQKGIDEV